MRFLLPVLALALLASPAVAKPLSKAEKTLCESAAQCADILSRHGPEAFDYDVLADAFNDMGADAAPALAALAKRSDLNLRLIAPQLEPGLLIAMFDTLAAKDATAPLGAELLVYADTMRWDPRTLPTLDPERLSRGMSARPSLTLLKLAERHKPDAALPLMRAALGGPDAQVTREAYAALFAASPDGALAALRQTVGTVQDWDRAKAIADMLVARFETRGDAVYATLLNGMAGDRALSEPMRDAARAGSLRLSDPKAPLTVDAAFAGQLARLAARGETDLARADHLRRAGSAVLGAWLKLAKVRPEQLPDILSATEALGGSDATRGALMRLALARPNLARANLAALHAMSWPEVGRYERELARLADTHPWDSVRDVARRRLERDVSLPTTLAALEASFPNRLPAQFCVRGEAVEAARYTRELPLYPVPAERDDATARRHLATALPTATRWLAGFDAGQTGGGLIAYDYATDGRRVLLRGERVQLIAPAKPVPLGQQPERLFIVAGDMRSGRVFAMAPDGNAAPTRIADLPAPMAAARRMEDGSLFLQFHGADETPSWATPPPLLLTPDGELRPGCAGRALVGEAPALFP